MKQISVFVENKGGSIAGVIEILSNNNINLQALSIADTSDYGIMRLIVDNPDKALAVLREYGTVVKCTEVIAVPIDDRPGGLSEILNILAGYNIFVSYIYAFVTPRQGSAVVVMKVDKTEEAIKCFANAGVPVIM